MFLSKSHRYSMPFCTVVFFLIQSLASQIVEVVCCRQDFKALPQTFAIARKTQDDSLKVTSYDVCVH